MTRIWKLDNITVYATGIVGNGSTVDIEGIANKNGRVYRWRAWIGPNQTWEVNTIVDSTDRTERYTGATINLGLEVAAAVKEAI